MSGTLAIRATEVSKCFQLYGRPSDRLKQMLLRGRRYYREHWALRDVSFELAQGEVLGIVGRNGAGKSTLLQLLCGTLSPSSGTVAVQGRVAALLELGAGFNPDFTGRENVFLNGAILGLRREELAARYEDIVRFSGIGDFIDQPVRTYSSGMFVRLAFSIATSVDPDILIVDEALSVGDGEFSRRSFERILELRAKGTTILFCSHALYQVEALCSRAIWLDQGRVAAIGPVADVVSAYRASLDRDAVAPVASAAEVPTGAAAGTARIVRVDIDSGQRDIEGNHRITSGKGSLRVRVDFAADPALPPPSLAVSFSDTTGRLLSGIGNVNDGVAAMMDAQGRGWIEARFDALPLLKGTYRINAVLCCENTIFVYDGAVAVATLEVDQEGLEQGFVHLPHTWHTGVPHRS